MVADFVDGDLKSMDRSEVVIFTPISRILGCVQEIPCMNCCHSARDGGISSEIPADLSIMFVQPCVREGAQCLLMSVSVCVCVCL